MTAAVPCIAHRDARRLFLAAHGLSKAPHGAVTPLALTELVRELGFVQIDSIRTVERAHDMILFARRQAYRPRHLPPLLEHHRTLFEHWTHDAALIPTEFFPHWHLRFARDAALLDARFATWQGAEFRAHLDRALAHVARAGCCRASDLGNTANKAGGGWWEWQPEKTALEYLWRSGALSIARRDGFRKVYDLTERVIPEADRAHRPDPEETIDWACREALARLGFATPGEISAFWDIVTPAEARAWCQRAQKSGAIAPADIVCSDGRRRRVLGPPDLADRAAKAPTPPARIRVLSPFDPVLRDRSRTERLFGFTYRIEIFTPAPKRVYGYYVFPLLEGDRLIGRMDMKADRTSGVLDVKALWPERAVRWSPAREERLRAELERVRRFAGLETIRLRPGWFRAAR